MTSPDETTHLDTVQLSASIEIMATKIVADESISTWLPEGTRVYLPDLGPAHTAAMPVAAAILGAAGAVPIPHIAARRVPTVAAFETHLSALSDTGCVTEVLVIAGEANGKRACFPSTQDVLKTGLLPGFGIRGIAVAGHPEGHPEMSRAETFEVLAQKQALADSQGLNMRIVTQFSFDPDQVLAWSRKLVPNGITAPVHVGLAGPTDTATLIKYAMRCGVGNSTSMLRRRGLGLLKATDGGAAENVAQTIETTARDTNVQNIASLHIYPFGGLERSRDWLVSRGNW